MANRLPIFQTGGAFREFSAANSDTIAGALITKAAAGVLGVVMAATGLTVDTSGNLSVSFGTSAGTVCQGNDYRLSDARTPTAHTHASITNTGLAPTSASTPSTWACPGLDVRRATNTGSYPSAYGNILSLNGDGYGQIMIGMNTGASPSNTGLWFRNSRNVVDSFSSWARVLDTAMDATAISNWNTAFSWGNHASAGYALATHNHDATYLKLSGGSMIGTLHGTNLSMSGSGSFAGTLSGVSVSGAPAADLDTTSLAYATDYAAASLVAVRLLNSGSPSTKVAGVGFLNTGYNGAYLFYDASALTGGFKYRNHLGTIVSLAETTALGNYALTSHNHDSAYLKLSGGTMTGNLLGSTSYNIGASANWWGTGYFTNLNVQNNAVWHTGNLVGDQTGHYHSADRAWANITGVPANVQNPQNYYLPLAGGTLIGSLIGTTSAMGVAKIGTSTSYANYAEFSHSSMFGTSSYALLQSSAGTTNINCATGKTINFSVNNGASILTISASSIAASQTITGTSATFSSDVTINGAISGSGNLIRNTGYVQAVGANQANIKGADGSSGTGWNSMELTRGFDAAAANRRMSYGYYLPDKGYVMRFESTQSYGNDMTWKLVSGVGTRDRDGWVSETTLLSIGSSGAVFNGDGRFVSGLYSGNGFVGQHTAHTDWAEFTHSSNKSSTSGYNVLCRNDGLMILNAPASQGVNFANGGVTIASVDAAGFKVGGVLMTGTNINQWNDVYNCAINRGRIGIDAYTGEDSLTWAARNARGNHFGRIHGVSGVPAYFNFIHIKETNNPSPFGVFGYSSDGNWYVGKGTSGAEVGAFHKVWTSADFNSTAIARINNSSNNAGYTRLYRDDAVNTDVSNKYYLRHSWTTGQWYGNGWRMTCANDHADSQSGVLTVAVNHADMANEAYSLRSSNSRFGTSLDTGYKGNTFGLWAGSVDAPTGTTPWGANWIWLQEMGHGDSNWRFQLAGHYFGDSLAFRRKASGAWQPWRYLVHADSSGNFSVAGTISAGAFSGPFSGTAVVADSVQERVATISTAGSYAVTNAITNQYSIIKVNVAGVTLYGGREGITVKITGGSFSWTFGMSGATWYHNGIERTADMTVSPGLVLKVLMIAGKVYTSVM